MSFWGGGARALSIVVSLSVLAVSVVTGTAASAVTPDVPLNPNRQVFHPQDDIDKSLFSAGNLISDQLFYNGNAMTQSAVQTFLNGQVPTCRTGYTCLKSYSTTTVNRPSDAMCGGYTGVAGETAAAIIFKVGQSCGISQKVLLVLLQKEQSLVSDDWPSTDQYDFATGYHCPDDPGVGCDPETTGFFQQVYGAAWQFKRYGNPPGTTDYFTWYPVHEVTNILFSDQPNCGSAPVAIWNKATAALYYYTPYQPNQAALNDFFGLGDRCSTTGNRNFWGIYTDWFGSTSTGTTPTFTRAAGADRFEAAVNISKQSYPTPPTDSTVYIANGLNFPDALGAAPAAAKGNGPLLLVTPDSVPGVVVTELQRLHPDHIRVVGGVNSVSAAVYSQLAGFTTDIARFQGADRYDASRQLVSSVWTGTVPRLFIATGANFPDALSAGAAAGTLGVPVLLVNGSAATLDDPTVALIQQLQPGEVDVVGGPNSVSAGIYAQLDAMQGVTAKRFSGNDRFAVSAALNADTTIFPTLPSAYLANGFTFPDALAGAAAAAKAKSPLYVAQAGCVTAPAAEAALNTTSKTFRLLGGTASIGTGVQKLTVCP